MTQRSERRARAWPGGQAETESIRINGRCSDSETHGGENAVLNIDLVINCSNKFEKPHCSAFRDLKNSKHLYSISLMFVESGFMDS